MSEQAKMSIILPCLNEERAIHKCLKDIRELIPTISLRTEIIVVDNGSTDASADIVSKAMADFADLILVRENRPGYGNAYLKGLEVATGSLVFMSDCDGTYDFGEIPLFIKKLDEGFDMVVGNRFSDGMSNGSMPWHHKNVGNPVLSWLIRLCFGKGIRDPLCGSRLAKKDALEHMRLVTPGMEFSAEMVISALQKDMRVAEIPVSYAVRIGTSKLRSFPDGFRYLSLILKRAIMR